nr:GNAT family N-acetyltransferase [Saccharibacillus sp. O23]
MRSEQPATEKTRYIIRYAEARDAAELSELRVRIDGETEHMDREAGEALIDERGFAELIEADRSSPVRLFLVAEADDRLVGYARCEAGSLRRFAHRAEFGVCVLRDYWGCGIGSSLLRAVLEWADAGETIAKIQLSVVATNESAIRLYRKYGFEIEGVLRNDRIHADGRFYDTVLMGRFRDRASLAGR